MSPRRRPDRADWPPSLTASTRADGRTYYTYRDPRTGKKHGLGYDQAEAIAVAAAVNAQLGVGRRARERILGVQTAPISDWIDHFERQILPGLRTGRGIHRRPLAESTIAGYRQRLVVIRTHWAGRDMRSITLRELGEFIADHPARMGNIYRATLMVLWRHARAAGWIEKQDADPADTLPRDEQVRRQPLDRAGYAAIREHAPSWMQRAMDLALESLQGRREIASALVADYDRAAGTWYVIRRKTDAHGTAARLRIHVWPALAATLDACIRDDIASTYVVHRLPARRKAREQRARGREHPTQVMPPELSRAFADARDQVERYAAMPPESRPTLHEIRALGADLKRKAGWPEQLIQALMAHTDLEMTTHYLARHEAPWTDVRAPGSDARR